MKDITELKKKILEELKDNKKLDYSLVGGFIAILVALDILKNERHN